MKKKAGCPRNRRKRGLFIKEENFDRELMIGFFSFFYNNISDPAKSNATWREMGKELGQKKFIHSAEHTFRMT